MGKGSIPEGLRLGWTWRVAGVPGWGCLLLLHPLPPRPPAAPSQVPMPFSHSLCLPEMPKNHGAC